MVERLTGGLNGVLIVSSGAGEEAATLMATCGVGGVKGAGTVCDV